MVQEEEEVEQVEEEEMVQEEEEVEQVEEEEELQEVEEEEEGYPNDSHEAVQFPRQAGDAVSHVLVLVPVFVVLVFVVRVLVAELPVDICDIRVSNSDAHLEVLVGLHPWGLHWSDIVASIP